MLCLLFKMSNSKLIYSTDSKFDPCIHDQKSSVEIKKEEQKVRLHLERKKGGKINTIIRGLILKNDDLKSFVREIKKKCASGGSYKNNDIIIQGDKREFLRKFLIEKGYNAKLSGG